MCLVSRLSLYILYGTNSNLYEQNSPEEEAELKKLKEIEKSVEQMAKKLEKVDGELTGLKNVSTELWLEVSDCSVLQYICGEISVSSQGFLAKDLQAEALSKLDNRVKVAAEQFMKILEQIDALVICFGFGNLCSSLLFYSCALHNKCSAASLLTECPRKF